jgi:S-adenosylmethionine:tRNA ribosyltransferase-isomerase
MNYEIPDNDYEAEIARYDYHLPETAIAQEAAEPRDSSRLLVLRRDSDLLAHHQFCDLPLFIGKNDLLVLNDTRVIPARLFGTKINGGGKAELFLVHDHGDGQWDAFVRISGKLRPELTIDLGDGFSCELIEPAELPSWRVKISGGCAYTLMTKAGHMPLPPYIHRDDTAADRERYQTVFAREAGAVAAPTAGLHFTESLLAKLTTGGAALAWVTLHVGPGTFRPLETTDLSRGSLHEEQYILPAETIAAIERTRGAGGRVIAVGTTTTRVLEACTDGQGRLKAGEGTTRIFLRPPYQFQVVDGLITNFHLPRSSLLMLVSALAGRERVLAAYEEAVANMYRFYSYGDAMLIL